MDGKALTFKDEETKSHFTNYSLTSSVLRRNEGLSKLDDCFEGKYQNLTSWKHVPFEKKRTLGYHDYRIVRQTKCRETKKKGLIFLRNILTETFLICT